MSQLDLVPNLPGIPGTALSPEQTRFNTLIGQLEQARKLIADWHHHIALYRKAYVDVQVPLLKELKATQREWVIALDAAIGARRWIRTEHETLVQLVLETIDELLSDDDDPELKAIFERYAEVDLETDRAMHLAAMKNVAQAVTGVDLGDGDEITDEAELLKRIQERMAAQAEAHRAAAEAHAASAKPKKKTAAQKKRESEAEEATLSVREIFRKLASALHPDREKDPAERQAKTVLMQQANQAYAANDLLALLELQLKIEQVDAEHLVGIEPKRLKHYNKVLAEQLKELRSEASRVAMQFTHEFNLDPAWRPNPKRLNTALAERTRLLRGAVAEMRQEMPMFENVPVMKRWLKRQRIRLDEHAFDMDDFF